MENKISKKIMNVKSRFSILKLKTKKFIVDIFRFLKKPFYFTSKFLAYSFVYGLIINYMLTSIFGVSFRLWSFPAYGILVYLIKEELPLIWYKFRSIK